MSENFEQQVKYLLDNVRLDPSPEVWKEVRQAIVPGKRKRRFIFWWILPVALMAGGVIYLLSNNDDNKAFAEKQNPPGVPGNMPANTYRRNMHAEQKENPGGNETGEINSHLLLDKQTDQRRRPGIAIRKNKKEDDDDNIPPRNKAAKIISKENKTSFATSASPVTNNPGNQTSPAPGNNNSGKIPGITFGKEMAIVKENTVKPFQKATATDTMQPLPGNATEKKPSLRSKWSFGLTAEAGISTLTDGGILSFGKKSFMDAGFSGPAGLPGGVAPVTYEHTTVAAKKSFGIYFTVHREIGKTASFQSSFGLRHQSFSVTTSILKDSIVTGNTIAYPVSRRTSLHRLNYLDLYTGISFSVFKLNELKLGIGAGIDNQFLVAGTKEKKEELLLYNQGTLQSMSTSLNGYVRWQPLVRLQIVADINIQKGKWLQLSPYINYGLRKFEKGAFSAKDHLAAFGLNATYFFR